MAFELIPCWFCSKPPENGQSRTAEGYIIVGHRNGEELTTPCPACEGTGYRNHREAHNWLKKENAEYDYKKFRERESQVSSTPSQQHSGSQDDDKGVQRPSQESLQE